MPIITPTGLIEDGAFAEGQLGGFQETIHHDRNNIAVKATGNAWGFTTQVNLVNNFDSSQPFYLNGMAIETPADITGPSNARIITPSNMTAGGVVTTIPPGLTSPFNASVKYAFFSSNSGLFTVDFTAFDQLTSPAGDGTFFPPFPVPPFWMKPGIWQVSIKGFSPASSGSFTGAGQPPPYMFTGNCVVNVYMLGLNGQKVKIFSFTSTLTGPNSPPNYLNTHSTISYVNAAAYPFNTVAILGTAMPWSIFIEVKSFAANPFVDGSAGAYPLILTGNPVSIIGP